MYCTIGYATKREAFSKGKSVNKSRILKLVVVVIVAVGLGAILGIWRWRIFHDKLRSDRLVLYGNVDIRQVQLAFDGNQRIATLRVREGDLVKKGQLLATMDTSRLIPLVNQDKALVASQRQILARLLAGSRPEEIARDRADVHAAQATALNAQIHLVRLRRLFDQRDITKQNLDDAIAIEKADIARTQAAQETLQLSILGPRKEDILAAKAALNAQQAQLALARRDLAESQLYAPCTAIVENRILEPGDMASPGAPVFTLALMNPVWVRTYVPESDLGKISEGMKATVRTDSYKKNYAGWIGYISPSAEFTPKSIETPQLRTSLVYQVRVYVNNNDNQLRLGMPATVIIPLSGPVAARTSSKTQVER